MTRSRLLAAVLVIAIRCPACGAWAFAPLRLPRWLNSETQQRRHLGLQQKPTRALHTVMSAAATKGAGAAVVDETSEYLAATDYSGIWDDDDDEDDERPFTGDEDQDDYVDIPYGSYLTDVVLRPELREEGWLSDSSVAAVADDYGFPVEFVMDALCRWGVPPPFKTSDMLRDLVNGEQAFAMVEALTSLDAAEVRDAYVDETLEEVAGDLGVTLAEVFTVCAKHRINMPLGVKTRITCVEYRTLCRELNIAPDTGTEAEKQAARTSRILETARHPLAVHTRRGAEGDDSLYPAAQEEILNFKLDGLFSGDLDDIFSDD